MRYRILKRASPPPPSAGLWPNWPMMNATILQGSIASTLLDSTNHPILADKDLVALQEHYENTTRNTSRKTNIAAVRAMQTAPMRTRFGLYVVPSVALKTFPSPAGQSAKELLKEIIDDPVKGNPRWYTHRVGGGTSVASRIEDYFDQPDTRNWQVNVAARTTERNSLNETLHRAFWKEKGLRLDISPGLRDDIDFFFMDVAVARPTAWYNGGATAVVVTDADLDYDGVADSRSNWSSGAGAGGRMWSEGQLLFKSECEAEFPGKFLIPNAPWAEDYLDGSGFPPLPMSNHPFYQRWELPMDEVSSFALGLRFDDVGGTGYLYNGGGSAFSWGRRYHRNEYFLKPDASIPDAIGRAAVLVHAHARNRVATAADIEFMRFTTLICLLVERAAPTVQQGGSRPFSVDESLVYLGNPLTTRSMGTLNPTTGIFSLRAANQTVGTSPAAQFYWAEFQHGIVVARLDNPTIGTWPSADAAVTCTLPAPGSGKKWQRLNADTYVNPITSRACRNQTPTLNNGADVTSVSLRPFHAVLIRRVNA